MFGKESYRFSKAREADMYGLERMIFSVGVKVPSCEMAQGVEAFREG